METRLPSKIINELMFSSGLQLRSFCDAGGLGVQELSGLGTVQGLGCRSLKLLDGLLGGRVCNFLGGCGFG